MGYYPRAISGTQGAGQRKMNLAGLLQLGERDPPRTYRSCAAAKVRQLANGLVERLGFMTAAVCFGMLVATFFAADGDSNMSYGARVGSENEHTLDQTLGAMTVTGSGLILESLVKGQAVTINGEGNDGQFITMDGTGVKLLVGRARLHHTQSRVSSASSQPRRAARRSGSPPSPATVCGGSSQPAWQSLR